MGNWNFTVQDVIDSCDIVEYMKRDHSDLKKRGRGYEMCCPFHNEKTPSFKVNPQKQFYHCFGCGETGNIITYVAKTKRLSNSEAITLLAEENGFDVYSSEGEKQDYSRAKAVIEEAVSFYQKNFDQAYDYVCLERGVSEEMVRKFKIGFAPRDNSLKNHLLRRGFTIPEIARQNLIVLSDGRSRGSENPDDYYDYFRGRIMFPVKNRYGYLVGFGSRITLEEETWRAETGKKKGPKYLNSSAENNFFGRPLYHKSGVVYGLAEADKLMSDSLYLVEGYLDVIMMIQAGIPAIAAQGTAFTIGQAKLIKRYTDYLINLGDPDDAGLNSLRRAMKHQLQSGILPLAKFLPRGLDPADFVSYHPESAIKALDDLKLYNPVEALAESLKRLHPDFNNNYITKRNFFNRVFHEFFELFPERKDQLILLNDLASFIGLPSSYAHAAFQDSLLKDIPKGVDTPSLTVSSPKMQQNVATQLVAHLLVDHPQRALTKLKQIPLSTPPFKDYQLTILNELKDLHEQHGQSSLTFDKELFSESQDAVSWLLDLHAKGKLKERPKAEISILKRGFKPDTDGLSALLNKEYLRFSVDQKVTDLHKAMNDRQVSEANRIFEEIEDLSGYLDW